MHSWIWLPQTRNGMLVDGKQAFVGSEIEWSDRKRLQGRPSAYGNVLMQSMSEKSSNGTRDGFREWNPLLTKVSHRPLCVYYWLYHSISLYIVSTVIINPVSAFTRSQFCVALCCVSGITASSGVPGTDASASSTQTMVRSLETKACPSKDWHGALSNVFMWGTTPSPDSQKVDDPRRQRCGFRVW